MKGNHILMQYEDILFTCAFQVAKTAIMVIATVAMATNAQRAKGFGNDILPSKLGFDNQPATFLLNDIILEEGVVYAFQAWFRNTLPMYFQVWRPACEGCMNHTLIGEVRVEPATGIKALAHHNVIEDVSLLLLLLLGLVCYY